MADKLLSFKNILKNLSTRILVELLLFLVIIAMSFVIYTYRSNINGHKVAEFKKLDAISKTLSRQINGDIHQVLFERYTTKDAIDNVNDDPNYLKIHKLLASTKEANGLGTDIYTLVLNEGEFFEYGVSSSVGTYYRHRWEDIDTASLENYETGSSMGPYRTSNGIWLSSFSPIKNGIGETVAIVQVDQEFDSFITEVRDLVKKDVGYIGLILLMIFGYLFYHVRKILRRENIMKLQLVHKKEIIEQKSKDLTDSINSAKKIQMAMFSVIEDIKISFPELFIMFEPRDIVSGDFFWYACKGNRSYFAVADCTGHGVPGALMSMVGNTMLNDIINNFSDIAPNKILEKLNKKVSKTLYKKDGTGSDDGMDIGICCFHHDTGKLEFSGALRPMIVISDKGLTKIGADRMAIGGILKKDKKFTNHVVDVKAGDTVYMYSDGYHDQFGGDRGKKYQSRKFRSLLQEVNKLHIDDQKYLLQYEFHHWKEQEEQIDDVLVAGFKIPELGKTCIPSNERMSA